MTIPVSRSFGGGRWRGQSVGVASQPAPSRCIDGTGPLQTLDGAQSAFNSTSLATDTRIQASTATWEGTTLTPVRFGGGSNLCWTGGLITGTFPASTTWLDMHDTLAIQVRNGTPTAPHIEALRVHNYGDGVFWNGNGLGGNALDGWVLKGCHISVFRDDGIQNDYGFTGTVDDCLFDGGFVGYSSRPAPAQPTVDQSAKVVTIQNSLIYLRDMPTGFLGDFPHHGRMWKMDNLNGNNPDLTQGNDPRLRLINNVFRCNTVAQCCGDFMIPPAHYIESASNNTFLWFTGTAFPDTIPSGFTVVTDVATGSSFWTSARSTWLSAHTSVAALYADPT